MKFLTIVYVSLGLHEKSALFIPQFNVIQNDLDYPGCSEGLRGLRTYPCYQCSFYNYTPIAKHLDLCSLVNCRRMLNTKFSFGLQYRTL